MKKVFVIVTVLFLTQDMFAQQDRQEEIPQHIVTAHSTKYPDVKVDKWKTKKEGYHASFMLDGKKRNAHYTASGVWKGTETKIRWTRHLPEKVQAGWGSSGHINWKVNAIRHLETPGTQLYVLHLSNGSLLDSDHHDAYLEERILYFSPDGELIKKDRI
ncbi:MAG TPA: hypothetical protein VK563_22460 [Puia sp.]|nr:hypothetical protein [Puia sp.]